MRIPRMFRLLSGGWFWGVTLLLGFVYLSQIWIGFSSYNGDDYEPDEEVLLRYIERELLFLESGREGNAFLKWWTGNAEREKTLKELTDLIPKGDHEWESWEGDYAEVVVGRTASEFSGEKVEMPEWVTAWPRQEMKEHLLRENAPTYLHLFYLSEGEDPEVRRDLEEKGKRLLWHSYVVWVIYLGGMLAAIGLTIWVWKKRREGAPLWRYPCLWPPALVLGAFFGGEIIANLFYDAFLVAAGVTMITSDLPWVLADFIWRGIPALFLMVIFFGSLKPMIRVFRLNEGVHWRLLIWALGFLYLVGYLSIWFGLSGDKVDPEDFLTVTNPNGMDVFEDLLSGVIAAPLFEELIFRGFLFLGLQRRIGTGWAALISSVLFAIIHIQYDVWGILSVGIFGLMCTWLAWRTRSLTTGIVLHMIYNLLISVDVFLIYQHSLRP